MVFALLVLSVASAAEGVREAAPVAHACPVLASEADVETPLLDGRVVVHVDLTDAATRNGLALAGLDAHRVVPLAAWRDSIRWTRFGEVAMIVAEDPIELAGADLTPPLERGATLRFGKAWLATAVTLPAPSADLALIAGAYDGASWGVAAALRLADGSVLQLSGYLTSALAADPECRDAMVGKLAAAQAGPRSRDPGGNVMSLPTMAGGTLDLPIAPGFALRVSANTEAELFSAVGWRPPGADAQEAYTVVVDFLPFDKAPRGRRDVVARDRVLGEPARWTASDGDPDREEAWIPGIFGTTRQGVIQLQVVAQTAERRAELRGYLEQATMELAAGFGAGRGTPVIQLQAPGPLVGP